MTTFLLTAICLFASNAAFSQTQDSLWLGCRPARPSSNTNGLFDAGQTADIPVQSSENSSDHFAKFASFGSNAANVPQRENIYTSLTRFLFSFIK